jgi:hypothetical protein
LETAEHEWIGIYFSEDMIPSKDWDLEFAKIADPKYYWGVRYSSVLPRKRGDMPNFKLVISDTAIGNAPGNFNWEHMQAAHEEFKSRSSCCHIDTPNYRHSAICHRSILDKCPPFYNDASFWLEGGKGNVSRYEKEFTEGVRRAGALPRTANRVIFHHFVHRREEARARIKNRVFHPHTIWPSGEYKSPDDWYKQCYLGEFVQ